MRDYIKAAGNTVEREVSGTLELADPSKTAPYRWVGKLTPFPPKDYVSLELHALPRGLAVELLKVLAAWTELTSPRTQTAYETRLLEQAQQAQQAYGLGRPLR